MPSEFFSTKICQGHYDGRTLFCPDPNNDTSLSCFIVFFFWDGTSKPPQSQYWEVFAHFKECLAGVVEIQLDGFEAQEDIFPLELIFHNSREKNSLILPQDSWAGNPNSVTNPSSF